MAKTFGLHATDTLCAVLEFDELCNPCGWRVHGVEAGEYPEPPKVIEAQLIIDTSVQRRVRNYLRAIEDLPVSF